MFLTEELPVSLRTKNKLRVFASLDENSERNLSQRGYLEIN